MKSFAQPALFLLLICGVFATEGEEPGDQSGENTVKDSGCICEVEVPECLCLDERPWMTVEIVPAEGDEGDPDRVFTITLDGPASFRRNTSEKEREQTGCPSRKRYRIHPDPDDPPEHGDTVDVRIDDEECASFTYAEAIFIINVIQPVPGKRAPYHLREGDGPPEERVTVGHTWIQFKACDTAVPREFRDYVRNPMSFSPESRDPRPTPMSPEVPGKLYENDTTTDPTVTCCFPITAEGLIGGLEYCRTLDEPSPTYHLSTRNCSSTAIEAGQAAGVPIESADGIWPGGRGKNPGDLGEDLWAMKRSGDGTGTDDSGGEE